MYAFDHQLAFARVMVERSDDVSICLALVVWGLISSGPLPLYLALLLAMDFIHLFQIK
jgi:hypothetical protein